MHRFKIMFSLLDTRGGLRFNQSRKTVIQCRFQVSGHSQFFPAQVLSSVVQHCGIVTLRGRRGTWRHRPPLCVAGVALMALHWLWWHTKLFHTTLSQIHFTHNFVTDSFHTQLCHTSLSHTTLSHTTLSHTTLSHTTLSHTTLSHTTFSHTSLSHTNFYTHHLYIHKLTHTHNTVTHISFTQPVLHHLLSFLPFPSHFHICLVIIGRSWFVGLSGPLI